MKIVMDVTDQQIVRIIVAAMEGMQIMTKDDKIWISICSAHYYKHDNCSMCKSGYWATSKILDAENELFTNDYAEWFRQHNNGQEPGEIEWEIWSSITGKEK